MESELRAPALGADQITVLLVEDDEMVRTLTARMLHTIGYDVLVAADGDEAISAVRARDGRIDLLITDVVMPGMSGAELGSRLAASVPGLKVLYVSGYLRRGSGPQELVSGEVPFLQKPFTPRELARTVRDILADQPVS